LFRKFNEKTKEGANPNASILSSISSQSELRVTGIYGDINEDRCCDAMYGLLALHSTSKNLIVTGGTEEEPEYEEVIQPISFYVSSHGGHAAEMFGVYDTMRMIREDTPIHTYGVGKVMSAGVLLLAAGTTGERRIGANCRVMIHGVAAGQSGHIADMENEFAETKLTQKMYIQSLASETNMEEKYIKKLIDKRTNVYFDAHEAVKLGIADIIF
tara:strand:- start:424 stop:1065 length:642 start_codon:yes stop_codon:yes gene_type:complete